MGKLVRRPWHGRMREAALENAFCWGLIPPDKDSARAVGEKNHRFSCPRSTLRRSAFIQLRMRSWEQLGVVVVTGLLDCLVFFTEICSGGVSRLYNMQRHGAVGHNGGGLRWRGRRCWATAAGNGSEGRWGERGCGCLGTEPWWALTTWVKAPWQGRQGVVSLSQGLVSGPGIE